jgi:hypothetical protein
MSALTTPPVSRPATNIVCLSTAKDPLDQSSSGNLVSVCGSPIAQFPIDRGAAKLRLAAAEVRGCLRRDLCDSLREKRQPGLNGRISRVCRQITRRQWPLLQPAEHVEMQLGNSALEAMQPQAIREIPRTSSIGLTVAEPSPLTPEELQNGWCLC